MTILKEETIFTFYLKKIQDTGNFKGYYAVVWKLGR